MKRGTTWPVAVAGILCLTIAGNIWLVRVANSDPSFAVEEDYYERGVRWDAELAQRARNAELGWQLLATLSTGERGRGADLRVTLSDSSIAPILGATVVVRAVHVARANDPIEVTLRAAEAGQYSARVPIERPGLWELRIDVHHGDDRFTALKRLDVRSAQP